MKKIFIAILAILFFILVAASCKTISVEEKSVIVPPLVFPIFPDLTDAQVNEDGTVSVSAEWIIQLAEYRLKVEKTQSDYEAIKEIYEEENEAKK